MFTNIRLDMFEDFVGDICEKFTLCMIKHDQINPMKKIFNYLCDVNCFQKKILDSYNEEKKNNTIA